MEDTVSIYPVFPNLEINPTMEYVKSHRGLLASPVDGRLASLGDHQLYLHENDG